MRKSKKTRIELLILNNNHFFEEIQSIKDANIGSMYVSVNKENISETREELININYTTRIFIARINNKNTFFIYGKKKGNKGVFNQHCKNTVYEYQNNSELYKHLIETSSNKGDAIFSSNQEIINSATLLDREIRSIINE